jgi:hypothetical protein
MRPRGTVRKRSLVKKRRVGAKGGVLFKLTSYMIKMKMSADSTVSIEKGGRVGGVGGGGGINIVSNQ